MARAETIKKLDKMLKYHLHMNGLVIKPIPTNMIRALVTDPVTNNGENPVVDACAKYGQHSFRRATQRQFELYNNEHNQSLYSYLINTNLCDETDVPKENRIINNRHRKSMMCGLDNEIEVAAMYSINGDLLAYAFWYPWTHRDNFKYRLVGQGRPRYLQLDGMQLCNLDVICSTRGRGYGKILFAYVALKMYKVRKNGDYRYDGIILQMSNNALDQLNIIYNNYGLDRRVFHVIRDPADPQNDLPDMNDTDRYKFKIFPNANGMIEWFRDNLLINGRSVKQKMFEICRSSQDGTSSGPLCYSYAPPTLTYQDL